MFRNTNVLRLAFYCQIKSKLIHVSNWNFQQKNTINLNRQVQINMTGYYLGVYVLSFTLKDGRVYTKNIIKE